MEILESSEEMKQFCFQVKLYYITYQSHPYCVPQHQGSSILSDWENKSSVTDGPTVDLAGTQEGSYGGMTDNQAGEKKDYSGTCFFTMP
jgi:hypothetical protein